MEKVHKMRAAVMALSEQNERYRQRLRTLMQHREDAVRHKNEETYRILNSLMVENQALKTAMRTFQSENENLEVKVNEFMAYKSLVRSEIAALQQKLTVEAQRSTLN